ncbi:MAG: tetratricopeptide repeat protein, partial [Deltaproteobacteria bacterium]
SALIAVAELHAHKLGNLPSAIGAYQRVVSEFAERPEARRAQLDIVSHYFAQKNFNQARLEAEALMRRWPASNEAAQARFELADALFGQRRYTEAVAEYESLSRETHDPSLQALVAYELGNCYQELGQTDRALGHYYSALAQHPNPLLVQGKIARVRARLHRLAPARRIMNARAAAGPARPPDPADSRDDVGRMKSNVRRAKNSVRWASEEVLAAPTTNTDAPSPSLVEAEPHEPTEAVVPDDGAPTP